MDYMGHAWTWVSACTWCVVDEKSCEGLGHLAHAQTAIVICLHIHGCIAMADSHTLQVVRPLVSGSNPHTRTNTHTHTLIHIRICTHTFVSCTHSPVTNLTRFCVLIGQWYALYGFDSPFSDQRMPTVSTAVPISMEGIVLQLFFIVIRYRVCACVGIA